MINTQRTRIKFVLNMNGQSKERFGRQKALDLTDSEFAILRRLRTPQRIQAFVNSMPTNHELCGETMWSVREVIRNRSAHCMEGALFAACALWVNGEPPLVMHLGCAPTDYPHVVALYRRANAWGAISKTNGVALRYRDPIYRSLRELSMSYFHEYSDTHGRKTLRSYSRSFDLRRADSNLWVTNERPCLEIHNCLVALRHYDVISRQQAHLIARRDPFECRASRMAEYPRPRKGERKM